MNISPPHRGQLFNLHLTIYITFFLRLIPFQAKPFYMVEMALYVIFVSFRVVMKKGLQGGKYRSGEGIKEDSGEG